MEDGSHPPFAYAAVHDSGRYTLVRLYGVCRKRKADGRGVSGRRGKRGGRGGRTLASPPRYEGGGADSIGKGLATS